MLADIIVIAILLVIVALVIRTIIKSKKEARACSVEWTAAIARAVINPRHGVYEAQDGHFMKRTHLPLKLHLPASVTIGGCMSKEAIEQKEVIVGKLKDSGCRITKQRLILLDVILEGECGSCKEIYYRARR